MTTRDHPRTYAPDASVLRAKGSAMHVQHLLAATAYTMSAGRLWAVVGGLLALTGVVIGGLALARPASRIGTGSGRLGAAAALIAGVLGMALGGLVVATSDGGVGTGNGR